MQTVIFTKITGGVNLTINGRLLQFDSPVATFSVAYLGFAMRVGDVVYVFKTTDSVTINGTLMTTQTASQIIDLLQTTVFNGDAAGGAATTSANNPIPIYNKSFWTDITTDWTVTGMTLTTNTDKSFRIPAGVADFTKFMTLKNATNNDENIDFEIIFKQTALTGAYGVPIGRKSSNSTYVSSLAVNLDFAQTTGSGVQLKVTDALGATGIHAIYTGNIAPIPTAGDMISLIYSQRGNTLRVYYRNLSTGFFASSPPIVCNLQAVGVTSNWNMPNTGDFCIWNNSGGPTDILSINITSFNNPNPKILWVGDSKTVGCASNYINARPANLCKGLGSFVVMAGTGDKTEDILADVPYIIAHFKPKYVILNIGRNDLSNSISSAVWQANYIAIVTAFKGIGATVIHMRPILESGLTQTALDTFITTTFPADANIDTSVGWSNGTHLSGDFVHPNQAGYRLIGNDTLACPAIINNNDQFENQPFTNNNIDVLSVGVAIPAGSSKYIQYNTSGSFDASANIQWDQATKSLGIGDRAPTAPLDIYYSGAAVATLIQSGLNSGAAYHRALNNSTNGLYFGSTGSAWTTALNTAANSAFIWATQGVAALVIQTNGTGGTAAPIVFNVNGAEAARIHSNGDLLLGTPTDDPTALLNVASTTKGVLLPRMTTTQKNAISSPTEGLEVYDITLHKKCVRTASAWETVTSS